MNAARVVWRSGASRKFTSFAFTNCSNSARHTAPTRTRNQSARIRGIRGIRGIRVSTSSNPIRRRKPKRQILTRAKNDGATVAAERETQPAGKPRFFPRNAGSGHRAVTTFPRV